MTPSSRASTRSRRRPSNGRLIASDVTTRSIVAAYRADLLCRSGHQAFNEATITVPGFCGSIFPTYEYRPTGDNDVHGPTERPPNPKNKSLPETGVMSVQVPAVMLYFIRAPSVPSYLHYSASSTNVHPVKIRTGQHHLHKRHTASVLPD